MFFEKNRFRADNPRVYGGQSIINLETRQAARVDRANSPRPACGLPAGPRRTIHRVLADSPPGPTGTSDSH
jgi:hypothetical protein